MCDMSLIFRRIVGLCGMVLTLSTSLLLPQETGDAVLLEATLDLKVQDMHIVNGVS